jgi:hypothetical protein
MNSALSLVTRATTWRAARPKSGTLWAMVLLDDPVPLICRPERQLFLSAILAFEFELDTREGHKGGMKAAIRKYIYSLRTGRDEADEFVSWHWHPENRLQPHVHVRAGHSDVAGLRDMHIPTSRVFFEDVLLFAITELNATCREGAVELLAESRRRTHDWATWR